MWIWLLALVLLASLAGLGYRQGAIRVGFSLAGILLGAILAGPLGKLIQPGLAAVGLKNPTLLWVLAPFIIFLLISILFKVAALTVHQKVNVHYKYRGGDLRMVLWERLNRRLGLCLGLLNGAAYLVLISFVIYAFSYWTVQMATPDTDPWPVRRLNDLGRDLQSTGFARVAKAIDPLPRAYYDTADIAGLIYNNSLLEARLSRYPAFLGLAERAEFQDIATDTQFTEMRQRREPIKNLLDYPKTQAILKNPDLLKLIGATLVPDLTDLRTFLETGRSPKYDSETILGRWNFDVNSAMAIMRRSMPNLPSSQMQIMKKWMVVAFAKTSLVAMTDHQAILKNVPQLKLPAAGPAPPPVGPQTLQGQWKNLDGKYQLTVSAGGKDEDLSATVEGDRLTIKSNGMTLAFNRED